MSSRTILSSCFLLVPLAHAPLAAQVWENRNQLLTDGGGVSLAQLGTSLAAGDFNGDGRTDLAVGAPNQTVSANASAGAVRLFLSGGSSGLALAGVATMAGTQSSQRYGAALVAGDFNNDGKDELVIGAPGWDTALPTDQVGEIVVWGYVAGVWTSLLTISQDTANVEGVAEANDHFGSSFAVGRFNDDLYDDLAIGVPDEDVGATNSAGAVNVIYGSGSGLQTTAPVDQVWYRGFGITGTAAEFQLLGRSLAAGDFDSDDRDDLAIGVDDTFSGHVVVLFGSAGALTGTGQQVIFHDDLPQSPSGGEFAAALAAADFDFTDACDVAGTCADDLLVGMPNATVVLPNMVSIFNAGKAFVIFGSSSLGELDPASAVQLTQLDLELPPASVSGPENGDLFGKAVAAGPLGGGANADLAIGVPEEGLTGASLGGGAHVLLSESDPLTDGLSQGLAPTAGLLSAPAEQFDRFGTALAIGDFDDDGFGDLAIGIPYHDVGANSDAGAVQILYGALFANAFESNGLTYWSNF